MSNSDDKLKDVMITTESIYRYLKFAKVSISSQLSYRQEKIALISQKIQTLIFFTEKSKNNSKTFYTVYSGTLQDNNL